MEDAGKCKLFCVPQLSDAMNEYAGLESKSLEDMVFEEVDPQQEEHFKGSYPGMSTTLSSVYKQPNKLS